MHTHTHTCNVYNTGTPIADYSILYSCYISTDIMYSVYIYYIIYNIYIYIPVYIYILCVCVCVCIVSYYIASASARHGMACGWRGPSTARNNALRVWDNTMQ